MARIACAFIAALFLLKVSTTEAGLTAAQKNAILTVHNRARTGVRPAASNMQRMVWSNELAQIAQSYANRCTFAHNSARSSASRTFSYVGENLAATNNPQPNYPSLVTSWENEDSNYNFDSNSCAAGRVCGHFTQMVWSSSNAVGCGATRCNRLTHTGFTRPSTILVCNYGPGGNYRGVKPYTRGASCSQCPRNRPRCQNKLCSPRSEEVGNQMMEWSLKNLGLHNSTCMPIYIPSI